MRSVPRSGPRGAGGARTRIWLGAVLALALASEAQPERGAETVFSRVADRVLKIEIRERGSSAKSVLGSGFFVSADGLALTNYHVISKVVYSPDRYQAFWVAEEEAHPLEVLALDVIHDLAVVRAGGGRPPGFLEFASEPPPQGAALFALGYPRDIGITIVEGTYNGLMRYALYDKIHFTGSLNPGMSGGPALDASGRVVGVNVSSMGNQVSFLVPAAQAAGLAHAAAASEFERAEDLLAAVREQLVEHQESYFSDLFTQGSSTTALGSFTVPTRSRPSFNCWGDSSDEGDELLYRWTRHACRPQDYLFLADDHVLEVVRLEHEAFRADRLGRLRFYGVLEDELRNVLADARSGSGEHVTNYRCRTELVASGGLNWKAVFCLRAYKRLAGLYDTVFTAAALGLPDEGLETTLVLSGTSFENARRVAQRYLELLSWRP